MNKTAVNESAGKPHPLVVGVGASAGGLESLQELLTALPAKCDFAIVFVQHLDASSQSLLPDLVRKMTALQVVQPTKRTQLQSDTVFIAPPGKRLSIADGFLILDNDEDSDQPATQIDHFFHSLAEELQAQAVGVILSGSGSDGTLGLKAISDAGGLTMAQSPASAKFDSMPRNAATTGVADHVFPPAEIAAELISYAEHLRGLADENAEGVSLAEQIPDAIPAIAETLLKATNHNFQHYKTSTLGRRIQRRMQVLKLRRASEYVQLLQCNPGGSAVAVSRVANRRDGVFRDPEAFDVLSKTVLPNSSRNARRTTRFASGRPGVPAARKPTHWPCSAANISIRSTHRQRCRFSPAISTNGPCNVPAAVSTRSALASRFRRRG